MKIFDNGIIREMTESEVAELDSERAEAQDPDEVSAEEIAAAIEEALA